MEEEDEVGGSGCIDVTLLPFSSSHLPYSICLFFLS